MRLLLLAAVMITIAVLVFNAPGFSGFDQMTEVLEQVSAR